MWQASQSVLLDKIIMSGMECILVKVAGVGLQEKDLGKTLNMLESKLRKLVISPASSLLECASRGLRLTRWRFLSRTTCTGFTSAERGASTRRSLWILPSSMIGSSCSSSSDLEVSTYQPLTTRLPLYSETKRPSRQWTLLP